MTNDKIQPENASPSESSKPGRSTGPRSEEGKARAARNSLKHGLTSREFFVGPDQLEDFVEFKATLLEEIQPNGALQMAAFNHLLHAAWTLDHIRAMEAGYLALGIDALESKEIRHALDLLLRYQARHERSYYRARKELEELQTAEVARGTLPPEVVRIVPPAANPVKVNSAKRTADIAWPVEETITITRKDPEFPPAGDPDGPEPERTPTPMSR